MPIPGFDAFIAAKDAAIAGDKGAAEGLLNLAYFSALGVDHVLRNNPSLLASAARMHPAFPMLYSWKKEENRRREIAIRKLADGSKLAGSVRIGGVAIHARDNQDAFCHRLEESWLPIVGMIRQQGKITPPVGSEVPICRLPQFPPRNAKARRRWAHALVDFFHPTDSPVEWDAIDRRAAMKGAKRCFAKRQRKRRGDSGFGTVVESINSDAKKVDTANRLTVGDLRAGLIEKVDSLLRSTLLA